MTSLSPIADHLWQSTLFAAATAVLVFALRKNRARVRYALWFAASVKFLIPFSVLAWVGQSAAPPSAPAAPRIRPRIQQVLEQVALPFTPQLTWTAVRKQQPSRVPQTVPVAIAIWLSGSAALACVWIVRWRRIRATVRESTAIAMDAPLPVRESRSKLEPGVFGIFRPILILPHGLRDHISAEQFQAILAHEFAHARRRDNQTAAIHMFVQSIFWFHPLVWWISSRLVEEREGACDEAALESGSAAREYADGILRVCRYYVESPLACAAGVTGADLKKRIRSIMTNRPQLNLTPTRRALLAAAGCAAIAGPIAIGMLNPVLTRAQAALDGPPISFEVASIKPSKGDGPSRRLNLAPGGGFILENMPIKTAVGFAFDVYEYQIVGGPGWMGSEPFDIEAKAPAGEREGDIRSLPEAKRATYVNTVRRRVQSLLKERFQLTFHREVRQMPIYALVVAKGGPKLQPAKESADGREGVNGGPKGLTGIKCSMDTLVTVLSRNVGRPVRNETGLTGAFDFTLEFTRDLTPPSDDDANNPGGASLFAALQEQLGLKLESKRGPADIIVIDRLEKPSAN